MILEFLMILYGLIIVSSIGCLFFAMNYVNKKIDRGSVMTELLMAEEIEYLKDCLHRGVLSPSDKRSIATIEAQQAQIKGLVEALEAAKPFIEELVSNGYPREGSISAYRLMEEGISILPAAFLQRERAREAVIEAVKKFEKFAAHKTGGLNRVEFFRFLARNAKDQNRACTDTEVWNVIADCVEALETLK